jgi:hypothetical protein
VSPSFPTTHSLGEFHGANGAKHPQGTRHLPRGALLFNHLVDDFGAMKATKYLSDFNCSIHSLITPSPVFVHNTKTNHFFLHSRTAEFDY